MALLMKIIFIILVFCLCTIPPFFLSEMFTPGHPKPIGILLLLAINNTVVACIGLVFLIIVDQSKRLDKIGKWIDESFKDDAA